MRGSPILPGAPKSFSRGRGAVQLSRPDLLGAPLATTMGDGRIGASCLHRRRTALVAPLLVKRSTICPYESSSDTFFLSCPKYFTLFVRFGDIYSWCSIVLTGWSSILISELDKTKEEA